MTGAAKSHPDEDEVRLLLERIPLRFSIKENRLEISYGERLLSEELRSPEMSEAASRISQATGRERISGGMAKKAGRAGTQYRCRRSRHGDGSFPEAPILKYFLRPIYSTRATRRSAEYVEKGVKVSLEEMQRRIRAARRGGFEAATILPCGRRKEPFCWIHRISCRGSCRPAERKGSKSVQSPILQLDRNFEIAYCISYLLEFSVSYGE